MSVPRQRVVIALTVGPIQATVDAWMSQSCGSSRETQALVQSMLQRLKLQSGTEIHGGSWPASAATATATRHEWHQARDRDPHQQTNGKGQNGSALVDSLGMGTDGDIIEGLSDDHGQEVRSWVFRDEFGTPAQDSGVDHTATGAMVNGEQGLVNGPILDNRKAISSPLNSPKSFPSPSCKDNTVGNNVDMGQTITSSAVSGHLFPVNTQKDAEGTSCARTNDKMEGGMEGKSIIEENFIHDAMHDVMHGVVTDNCNIHSSLAGNSTSASQKPNNSNPETTAESGACGSPSFSPRVYTWSLKGPITGIEEIPIAHTGNEDSGALAQSHDVKIESKMPNSTSASRRRNRGFGNKTKRWTQKIKEKIKERGGSLKKKKEEEIEEVKVEEEGKISIQNEHLTTEDVRSVSKKTLETTSGPTDAASILLADSAVDMR